MISNTSGNEVANTLSSFQIEKSDSFVKKAVLSEKTDSANLPSEDLVEAEELNIDYEDYMHRCDERANHEIEQKSETSINNKYKQAIKAYSEEKIDLTEIEINTEA
ncbi:hypothetical protein IJX73_03585 [bacterium]|nr:hypothetical protein [bacterium]